MVNNNLTIYHDGGEPLYKGEYYVKINNDRRDDYIITPNGGNIWSVGKSLEFNPVPMGPQFRFSITLDRAKSSSTRFKFNHLQQNGT